MPAKSKAQLKYLNWAASKGKVPQSVADDFNEATHNYSSLPEHVAKHKSSEKKAYEIGAKLAAEEGYEDPSTAERLGLGVFGPFAAPFVAPKGNRLKSTMYTLGGDILGSIPGSVLGSALGPAGGMIGSRLGGALGANMGFNAANPKGLPKHKSSEKKAYEIGDKLASEIKIPKGLLDSILRHALISGTVGAGTGALSADEGNRLTGALNGALLGGVGGVGGAALGAYGGGSLGKLLGDKHKDLMIDGLLGGTAGSLGGSILGGSLGGRMASGSKNKKK